MAVLDSLPKEYGYVVIVLVVYCIFNFWMSISVGMAHKKFDVPYPTMAPCTPMKLITNPPSSSTVSRTPEFTGDDAHVFHADDIGRPQAPLICASLGVLYIFARFFYFKGYSTGDPQKRLSIGKYGFFAIFGLMFCTMSCGVHILAAKNY